MRVRIDSVLERAADARYRLVGEEAVVVRQESAEVAGLNEVAACLFDRLDGALSVAEVVEAVCPSFDVDREEFLRDAIEFLDGLMAIGLVVERRDVVP